MKGKSFLYLIEIFELKKLILKIFFRYGINPLGSQGKAALISLSELQDRAKTLLNLPAPNTPEYSSSLRQLIEDFSRESEQYTEEVKQDIDDLRLQVRISVYFSLQSHSHLITRSALLI